MRRRISLLVVLSLLLFTVMAVSSFASEKPLPRQKFNPIVNLVKQWSFAGTEKPVPGAAAVSLGQPVERAPLDGPGYQVGSTWYDYQRNGSMRRMIVRDTITVGKADLTLFVSGSYMKLPARVFENRSSWFWTYDAFNGVSPCPAGVSPYGTGSYSGYTTTEITKNTRAIVTSHNDQGSGNQTHAVWQQGPGICNFIKNCRVPDGLADFCEVGEETFEETVWPAAAWQEGTDTVLNVLAQERQEGAGDPQALIYARAENPEASCEWTLRCVDTVYTLAEEVDATNGGRVILAWTANLPCEGDPCDTCSGYECRQYVQLDNDVYFQISEDYGVTWQNRVNVTKHTDSCETDTAELRPYRSYVDVSALFDSENKWHIVWNERYWPGDANCGGDVGYGDRIFHWSQDLAAIKSDIKYIRTVHNAVWDQEECNPGAWSMNACKQTVSECDGKLYVLFTLFNDGPAGIFDDCATDNNPGFPGGAANGELYVSVSDDGGVSWDRARNITNTRWRWSEHPDDYCDSVGGNEPCPSEHWSSMARFGTNYVGSFPSNTVIPPNGTGHNGWYLDVQYIDDPSAGGIVQNQGWWQEADVKWFRLACVDPITCPAINLLPSEIGFPTWLKPGATKNIDIDVENSGNATLNYTLTPMEDVQTGWLTVSGFDGSVPSGLSNVETGTVKIDADGFSSITYLKGHLAFNVTDTCCPDVTVPIECWVTDTLIPPIWDTIFTVCDGDTTLGLIVANTGNFGNQGKDSVTMDYTAWAGDTCSDASVYLFDGSPVVGYKKGSDTLCNFSLFQTTYVHEDGFVPYGDYTPTTDMGEYEVFESGPFVTHDSQVVVEKVWYAPKMTGGTCSFVIECIKVYGRTGTVSGVRVGEAIDFDIPSDSGSDNSSGFDAGLKLMYQQGSEEDTLGGSGCLNNKRFGGINFLEAYLNDVLYKPGSLPYGAYTRDNKTYVYPEEGFVPEELYTNMSMSGYSPYSSANPDSQYVDLHTVMTFDTGLTVSPTNVYKFYVGILTHWDGDLASFLAEKAEEVQWYEDHIKPTPMGACCDTSTGDCSYGTEAECDGEKEAYEGDWTDCNPNPCALTCCNSDGKRGDVNYNGGAPNVADVTYLVYFLFKHGPQPPCFEEGDVNGNGAINVADVTYLVYFLFKHGPAPVACP